jgi:hypothetical protein
VTTHGIFEETHFVTSFYFSGVNSAPQTEEQDTSRARGFHSLLAVSAQSCTPRTRYVSSDDVCLCAKRTLENNDVHDALSLALTCACGMTFPMIPFFVLFILPCVSRTHLSWSFSDRALSCDKTPCANKQTNLMREFDACSVLEAHLLLH